MQAGKDSKRENAPLSVTVPVEPLIFPVSTRMSDVLPEPEGPMIAVSYLVRKTRAKPASGTKERGRKAQQLAGEGIRDDNSKRSRARRQQDPTTLLSTLPGAKWPDTPSTITCGRSRMLIDCGAHRTRRQCSKELFGLRARRSNKGVRSSETMNRQPLRDEEHDAPRAGC
jgi:hypothetical protein